MAKKKVLVCGATGFIGRNVAERLAAREDLEITGTYLKTAPFSNPKIKFVEADLTKKEDAEKVVQGSDVVIQAAAVTTSSKDIVSKPYIHVTDNVIMNARILQAVFDYGVPQHIFTSCAVMYPPELGRPVKEEDVDYKTIENKYFGAAWMKMYVEKLCEFYAGLKKTKFTIIRHSNIYGPHDKTDLEKAHVLSSSIVKVLANTDGTLQVWGDGSEGRDLLYISDMLDFVELVIDAPEKPDYGIYNVGLGKTVSIKDLVEMIIKESGKELSIKFDPTKPHIPTNIALNTDKAKTALGWELKTPIEEGIKLTMQWYKENVIKNAKS